MKLEIKDLTIIRDRPLLENTSINCEFSKLQLSGSNGSGKSTFIEELLNGNKQINVEANKVIHIDNKPILFNNLSITANFELLASSGYDALKYLEYFDLNMKQKAKKLSGGQKQILHILIALSHKSDLYIIDEPFNNLDQKNRYLVTKILTEEQSNMIIVAHGYNLGFCDVHLTIMNRELCYEK